MNAIKTEWPQSFVEATGLNPDDEKDILRALYEPITNKDWINVVELYYKEKMSYDQISRKYNVTRERIRQIIRTVITRTVHAYEKIKWEDKTGSLNPKDIPIVYTALSTRAQNALLKYLMAKAIKENPKTTLTHDSFKLGDILDLSINEICEIRNVGVKTLEEILIYLRNEPLFKELREKEEEDE